MLLTKNINISNFNNSDVNNSEIFEEQNESMGDMS